MMLREEYVDSVTNTKRMWSRSSRLYVQFYMSFTPPSMPTFFLSLRPVTNRMLSISEATVRTPPTIAQVLRVVGNENQGAKVVHDRAYEVRKCANDCLVSECTTRIGEISKLKYAPEKEGQDTHVNYAFNLYVPGEPEEPC